MLGKKFKILLPLANKFLSPGNAHKAFTPIPVTLFNGNVTFSQSHSPPHVLSSKPLTKNIQLITNSSKEIKTAAGNNLQVVHNRNEAEERPLSIIFCWLMSEKKHILKYANFYLDQGFDVLTVQTTPWQILWPVSGTQVIANHVISFMSQNPQYRSTMIHGFSVGGYLWGEVLGLMQSDPKYQPVIDNIRGQIWDSPVDFEGIPTGLPNAVFPNNAVLRTSLEKYMRYHMSVFHDVATKHYLASSKNYHNTIVKAPALFLGSLDDPVGSITGIQKVINTWEKNGMKVYLKCWDSSPHVSHLHHHPKEYKEEMKAFLEKLGLLPYPEKFTHKASARQ